MDGSEPRSNPPWSNAVLTSQWDTLLAAVGPKLMPLGTWKSDPKRPRRTRIVANELGTGGYGVVMPTETPGIVMKLTHDHHEADFIEWVLAHRIFAEEHPGLIPYSKMVRLPSSRRGQSIVAVWRAEAAEVGSVLLDSEDNSDKTNQCVAFARDRLDEFRDAAQEVAHQVERGGTVPKGQLAAVRDAAEEMIVGDFACPTFMKEIGRVLLDLINDHGILLGDVHPGNVGMYRADSGRFIAVITDPGYAVFLKADDSLTRNNPGDWPREIARAVAREWDLADGDFVVVVRRNDGSLDVRARAYKTRKIAAAQATRAGGIANASGYAVTRHGSEWSVWVSNSTRLFKGPLR